MYLIYYLYLNTSYLMYLILFLIKKRMNRFQKWRPFYRSFSSSHFVNRAPSFAFHPALHSPATQVLPSRPNLTRPIAPLQRHTPMTFALLLTLASRSLTPAERHCVSSVREKATSQETANLHYDASFMEMLGRKGAVAASFRR